MDNTDKLFKITKSKINMADLNAKNRRVEIPLSNGTVIKYAPSDLSYIDALSAFAISAKKKDDIKLMYADDDSLELKTIRVSLDVLKSIASFLAGLSLRIDLKKAYRLQKLNACKTQDDYINLQKEIKTEERALDDPEHPEH